MRRAVAVRSKQGDVEASMLMMVSEFRTWRRVRLARGRYLASESSLKIHDVASSTVEGTFCTVRLKSR